MADLKMPTVKSMLSPQMHNSTWLPNFFISETRFLCILLYFIAEWIH